MRDARRAQEVRRLDDQGVSLPPADRVAAERPVLGRGVLGVEAHDPRPVHPFDVDRHVSLGLRDRLQVVVGRGPDRHRGAAGVEAARSEGLDFRLVVEVVAGLQPPGAAGIAVVRAEAARRERLSAFRLGRQPAIGRVRDDRVAVLAVDLERDRAEVEPELVVAADVAAVTVAADRRGLAVRVAGDVGLDLRRLRGGRDPVRVLGAHVQVLAVLRIAHHGRAGGDVVGAGEVRPAARRPGNVVLGGGSDGSGQDGCEHQQSTPGHAPTLGRAFTLRRQVPFELGSHRLVLLRHGYSGRANAISSAGWVMPPPVTAMYCRPPCM